MIVVFLLHSPLGSTSTASLPPHPCKPTGRSSGGQLGNNKDIGYAAGEGGSAKHDAIEPPLLFVGVDVTLPAIRRLPTPRRSSRCYRNASDGPPPLRSFPNSCGATRGSTPQSSASWVRDDARLPSLLPPSGPAPTFVRALLCVYAHFFTVPICAIHQK